MFKAHTTDTMSLIIDNNTEYYYDNSICVIVPINGTFCCYSYRDSNVSYILNYNVSTDRDGESRFVETKIRLNNNKSDVVYKLYYDSYGLPYYRDTYNKIDCVGSYEKEIWKYNDQHKLIHHYYSGDGYSDELKEWYGYYNDGNVKWYHRTKNTTSDMWIAYDDLGRQIHYHYRYSDYDKYSEYWSWRKYTNTHVILHSKNSEGYHKWKYFDSSGQKELFKWSWMEDDNTSIKFKKRRV